MRPRTKSRHFLASQFITKNSFRICSECGPIVGRDKKGQANQVVYGLMHDLGIHLKDLCFVLKLLSDFLEWGSYHKSLLL